MVIIGFLTNGFDAYGDLRNVRRNIFSLYWHHRDARPQAAVPCSVHCIRIYGHDLGMLLFGLGGPNIPSLPLHGCAFQGFVSFPNPTPQTPILRPPNQFLTQRGGSEQFCGMYCIRVDTPCVNHVLILRVLHCWLTLCPMLSKVPLQHFPLPPDP